MKFNFNYVNNNKYLVVFRSIIQDIVYNEYELVFVFILLGEDMAFDISKLTSAVNKYLNSLSEISYAAKRSNEEIVERAQFSVDLKDAIAQNMQSMLRDDNEIPDIAKEVQSVITKATNQMDNTVQQINGSFEAMRDAQQKNSKVSPTEESSSYSGNHDAYTGLLSTEALQDLSKSQYFSANLIQNALMKFNEEEEEEASASLSGLNTTSLLANSLTSENAVTDILKTANTTDSSDLAKALMKAYANSGISLTDTSVFGDFAV